jgi:hypothetical protein
MLVENKAETEVIEIESQDQTTEQEAHQDDWQEQDSESQDDEQQDADESEEDEFYLGDEKLDSPTSDEEAEADEHQDDEKTPQWVKDVRAEIKLLKRENKELKEKSKQPEQSKVEAVEHVETLPAKPKLEDFDYDGEAFSEAIEQWTVKKSAIESENLKKASELDELKKKHDEKVTTYNTRKAALKVKDFDVAEKAVIDEVPQQIQSAILHYSNTPEMIVLALGRSKDLRDKAAKITDPVELGRFIGSIEAKAKIAPKSKNSPAPTPKVAANNGAGKQDLADKALHKAFPDAVFK